MKQRAGYARTPSSTSNLNAPRSRRGSILSILKTRPAYYLRLNPVPSDHGSVALALLGGSSDRIRDSARSHTVASHSIWVWAFTKTRSYQG